MKKIIKKREEMNMLECEKQVCKKWRSKERGRSRSGDEEEDGEKIARRMCI
jgi:hypothetical protein